jgi:hypothetical protein
MQNDEEKNLISGPDDSDRLGGTNKIFEIIHGNLV